eukprot:3105967-Prymnesium_polylepis.2
MLTRSAGCDGRLGSMWVGGGCQRKVNQGRRSCGFISVRAATVSTGSSRLRRTSTTVGGNEPNLMEVWSLLFGAAGARDPRRPVAVRQ